MSDEQLLRVETTHAMQHYKNHCEFLGYIVEEIDEFSISCRHPRKESFRLFLLSRGSGILFQIVFGFPKYLHDDLTSLYMYANDLNTTFSFIKACIRIISDSPPWLFLTSVYEGEYSRQNFSVFIENIHEDMDKYNRHFKTIEMWKEHEES